jgi:hypothetical protein
MNRMGKWFGTMIQSLLYSIVCTYLYPPKRGHHGSPEGHVHWARRRLTGAASRKEEPPLVGTGLFLNMSNNNCVQRIYVANL